MYASLSDNHLDTVDMLLRLGAAITAQDNEGLTPMHFAAENVRME